MTAASQTPFLEPDLPGNVAFEGWENLTRTNPQVANADPPFPGFSGSTQLWPEALIPNVADSAGNAGFDKTAGGGYPAGQSIYNSFNPGTYAVLNDNPISDLETVVFQINLAPGIQDLGDEENQRNEFFLDETETPVLNFNGQAQALQPIASTSFDSGLSFPNPSPGPSEVEAQIFAFQWDLTGIIDPITQYEIVWTTTEFGTAYALQLDSGDSFLNVLAAGVAGDYDGSGSVEQGDLNLVLNNWGTDATGNAPNSWVNDLPTGVIDQGELNGVLNNWGSSSAPSLSSGSAVPEPATAFAVIAIGGGCIARSRSRRGIL
ncbi:MAG: hypothetical protein AAF916_10050 [Planctomycetota bacterium]